MDNYDAIASKGYLWIYDIKNNRITKHSNVLIMNSWMSNNEFDFYINGDGNYVVYGLKNDDKKAYNLIKSLRIFNIKSCLEN